MSTGLGTVDSVSPSFSSAAPGAAREIAMFMPPAEDASNRTANEFARLLATESNFNLVLFITKQKKDSRVAERPFLAKKSFLHKELLEGIIFPFQRANPQYIPADILLAPDLLSLRYPGRVRVVQVDDPNDETFIQKHITENPDLEMAFSVRNLRIFKEPIIEAFDAKGPNRFINLHPGPLPGIKGLEANFWTRVLGYDRFTTTMHKIIRGVDDGPTLDVQITPINGRWSDKATAAYTRHIAPKIAELMYKQVQMHEMGAERTVTVQSKGSVRKTLPTNEEIEDAYKRLGIKLVIGNEQMQALRHLYTNEDDDPHHSARMMELCWSAYNAFQRGEYVRPNPRSDEFLIDDYPEHYGDRQPIAEIG